MRRRIAAGVGVVAGAAGLALAGVAVFGLIAATSAAVDVVRGFAALLAVFAAGAAL